MEPTTSGAELSPGLSRPDTNQGGGLGDSSTSWQMIYLKIVIGSLLVLVILVSIFGNLLVCVAIASDRRLRRLGNLFIVSLAIADLCVGALVMTFALANDMLDYWPFGPQLCEIWIAFDISCSTCSIINLCAIALDRFVHIKDPMRYNRWMTKKIVVGCVSIIWLVSCLISFLPISLGWHRPVPPTTSLSPPPSHSMGLEPIDSSFLLTPEYWLYPNLVPNLTSSIDRMQQVPIRHPHWLKAQAQLSEPEPGSLPQCALDLTPTYAVVSSTISFYMPCIIMLYLYAKLYSICQEHVKCIKSMTKPFVPPAVINSPRPHQSNHHPKSVPITVHHGSNSSPFVSTTANQTSASQQSHVSEHKAAVTLGIIMGTFLACWMPFFCMNIVAAFCKTCISGLVFKILTWLGYFNSCLNPAIYSIFNTEFRDAFRRIIVRYLFNGEVSHCNNITRCTKSASNVAPGQASSLTPSVANHNAIIVERHSTHLDHSINGDELLLSSTDGHTHHNQLGPKSTSLVILDLVSETNGTNHSLNGATLDNQPTVSTSHASHNHQSNNGSKECKSFAESQPKSRRWLHHPSLGRATLHSQSLDVSGTTSGPHGKAGLQCAPVAANQLARINRFESFDL